jgi:RNA polymerase sigma factor (sigma-70 family)
MSQERETETRDWVAQAQQGDLEAFSKLVDRFAVVVRLNIGRVVRDADATLDLAQDTFLAAFENLASFDGRNFPGWLATIARNKALNHVKKKARAAQHERAAGRQRLEAWYLEAAARDADAAQDRLVHLDKCVEELTGADAPSARLIHDYYHRKASVRDLASAHKKSESAIYKTLHRIRQLLGDCIGRKVSPS